LELNETAINTKKDYFEPILRLYNIRASGYLFKDAKSLKKAMENEELTSGSFLNSILMLNVFNHYDKDEDGRLNKEELTTWYKDIKMASNEAEGNNETINNDINNNVEKLWSRTNQKGLSLEDFLQEVNVQVGISNDHYDIELVPLLKLFAVEISSNFMHDVQTVSDKIVDDECIKNSFETVLQYMFLCYDTDGNSSLSKSEFARCLEDILGSIVPDSQTGEVQQVTDEYLSKEYSKIDFDNKKEIGFLKFDKYIKKRMKEEIDVISGSRIVFLRE